MTPQQHAIHLLQSSGFGFIGIGAFYALFNWGCLFADQGYRRRGENRHVSMVGLMGLGLPIGCLIVPDLRIHALWVWLLDPASIALLLIVPLEALRNLFRSNP